jgi:hypothetical protein
MSAKKTDTHVRHRQNVATSKKAILVSAKMAMLTAHRTFSLNPVVFVVHRKFAHPTTNAVAPPSVNHWVETSTRAHASKAIWISHRLGNKAPFAFETTDARIPNSTTVRETLSAIMSRMVDTGVNVYVAMWIDHLRVDRKEEFVSHQSLRHHHQDTPAKIQISMIAMRRALVVQPVQKPTLVNVWLDMSIDHRM